MPLKKYHARGIFSEHIFFIFISFFRQLTNVTSEKLVMMLNNRVHTYMPRSSGLGVNHHA